MRKTIDKYLSSEEWLIKEKEWDEHIQHSVEARFTLSNGYIGSRGILEENPRTCWPGTFFAGVYDSKGAHTSEIVNAPNPIDFRIRVGGEKLDVSTMDYENHEFVLDMKNGALGRKTLFKNVNGDLIDYQSIRFFSMDNKHSAVLKIYLTPLTSSVDLFIEHQINLDTFNKGILTEGTKRHIKIMEFSKENNNKITYFRTETYEYQISISYASILEVEIGNKKFIQPHRTFSLKVNKGQTVCFTKYFSFFTSRDIDVSKMSKRLKIYETMKKTKIPSAQKIEEMLSLKNPKIIKNVTIRNLKEIYKKGFDKLFKDHITEMNKRWENADVKIYGEKNDQKALRFNIYHLLITGNEKDENVSIPAKTLSGEGYSGHIFWDTEIFMLPFFIYTHPEIAKNMLMYRYHRLASARELAKSRGYKGAMFPWESEAEGKEATPQWFKDVVGNVIRIYTGERENHIVSDVSYGVCHYYNATGDENFMVNYGMEIMLDTAKFWISRLKKKGKKYVLEQIIGPDELHENVNNNFYTNYCAKWNIKEAVNLYYFFKRNYGDEMENLLKKLNITENILKKWLNISENIKLPHIKNKIVEQFDGYFKKKFVPIKKYNKYGLPLIPEHLKTSEDIAKTQLIKQPDVTMTMILFSTEFDYITKKKNYEYYRSRNTHKSSLSPSMEGIIGIEVGDIKQFYKFFKIAENIDLKDINKNCADGVHGASCGGTWQMIFLGLLGFRRKNGKIKVRPYVVPQWRGYNIKIKTKEGIFIFDIHKKNGKVKFVSKENKVICINIYDEEVKLISGKERVFNIKNNYIEK